MNSTIHKMLRSTVNSHPQHWDDLLPYVLMAYRATVHESTKCTANLLPFGSENKLPVDLIYAEGLSTEKTIQCPCEYVEWVREASRKAFEKLGENPKKKVQNDRKGYMIKTHSYVLLKWVTGCMSSIHLICRQN